MIAHAPDPAIHQDVKTELSHATLCRIVEVRQHYPSKVIHFLSPDGPGRGFEFPGWLRRFIPQSVCSCFVRFVQHGSLGMDLHRIAKQDVLVITEFYCWFAHCFYLLALAAGRRELYILTFHDQQLSDRSTVKRIVGLWPFHWFLRWSGARAITMEIGNDGFPKHLQFAEGTSFRIRMPPSKTRIASRHSPRGSSHKLKIGVVGYVRKEKGFDQAFFSDIVKAVDSLGLRDEVTLCWAFPFHCVRAVDDQDPVMERWELIDTSDPAAYDSFLDDCDIVCLNYDASSYRFRSSGVVQDALTHGCAVVAPDLPIIREQITWPATMGAVYSDSSRIGESIDACIRLLPQIAEHHSTWMKERTPQPFLRSK